MFPINKDIYIYLEIETTNTSDDNQQINLVAEILKSKGIEVTQSQGPIEAKIDNTPGLDGEQKNNHIRYKFLNYARNRRTSKILF